MLFALHDLMKDSPFSRLDLVSCRNLLIYLNRDASRSVFEILHFALRPDGLLFLGVSETVDDDRALFTPLDKKHRIYAQRRRYGQGRRYRPAPRAGAMLDQQAQREAQAGRRTVDRQGHRARLAAAARRVLGRAAPAS